MKTLFTAKAFVLSKGQWRFSPSWFMLIGFVLVLTLFLNLRQWQVDRAYEKQQQLQQIEARLEQASESVERFSIDEVVLKARLYQPVRIEGKWLNHRALIQDNVTLHGVSGFNVILPMQLASNQLVLIDLGWKEWGLEKVLPTLNLPQGQATVEGMMVPALKRFALSDAVPEGWPKVVQYIDYKMVEKQVGTPVVPMLIRQQSNDDFIQIKQLVFGNPDKHRAYALQWSAFSFILCILFLGLNVKKINTEQRD